MNLFYQQDKFISIIVKDIKNMYPTAVVFIFQGILYSNVEGCCLGSEEIKNLICLVDNTGVSLTWGF